MQLNIISISTTLLMILVHGWIYPPDEPGTHLAHLDEAALVRIHPSASVHSLDTKTLKEQINRMQQERFFNEIWYEETYINRDETERFPYLLVAERVGFGNGVLTLVILIGIM